jgi:hypothetical protein
LAAASSDAATLTSRWQALALAAALGAAPRGGDAELAGDRRWWRGAGHGCGRRQLAGGSALVGALRALLPMLSLSRLSVLAAAAQLVLSSRARTLVRPRMRLRRCWRLAAAPACRQLCRLLYTPGTILEQLAGACGAADSVSHLRWTGLAVSTSAAATWQWRRRERYRRRAAPRVSGALSVI